MLTRILPPNTANIALIILYQYTHFVLHVPKHKCNHHYPNQQENVRLLKPNKTMSEHIAFGKVILLGKSDNDVWRPKKEGAFNSIFVRPKCSFPFRWNHQPQDTFACAAIQTPMVTNQFNRLSKLILQFVSTCRVVNKMVWAGSFKFFPQLCVLISVCECCECAHIYLCLFVMRQLKIVTNFKLKLSSRMLFCTAVLLPQPHATSTAVMLLPNKNGKKHSNIAFTQHSTDD